MPTPICSTANSYIPTQLTLDMRNLPPFSFIYKHPITEHLHRLSELRCIRLFLYREECPYGLVCGPCHSVRCTHPVLQASAQSESTMESNLNRLESYSDSSPQREKAITNTRYCEDRVFVSEISYRNNILHKEYFTFSIFRLRIRQSNAALLRKARADSLTLAMTFATSDAQSTRCLM